MNLPGTKLPFLFLLPGIALLLAFNLIPFINTLLISFKNVKLILPQEKFSGLNNYQAILTDTRFWYSFSTTLLYTFVSTSLEAIMGLCMGIVMNRLSPRNNFLRILIFIPWIIPTVVTARIWQWMFDYNLGIINYFLEVLAIKRTNWLGDPFLAFFSLVIADVWKTTPFVAIIILAGLSTIPLEIYQSSIIDGASSWQRFRFITLPLILPVLGVAILFRAIDALRIFDLVYVLTGGGPGGSTETLSIYAYKLFFYKGDFGQGAATSVIILLLVAGFSYFYTKKSFTEEQKNT
jgi:trehalose/maltose transport system permease protein